jgi:hypothetical protein
MENFFVKNNGSEGTECISLIDDAIEHILENEKRQSVFKEKNTIIQRTYKAILPDKSASEFHPVVKLLQVLADKFFQYLQRLIFLMYVRKSQNCWINR